MFLGNNFLFEDFKKIARSGKISQGYIFFGEPQIGKFTFAISLANFLENNVFKKPVKTLTETLIIKKAGIDSVREIKNFLWQRPHNSLKRTVIIDNSDFLTAEAQNAILKITEEPPNHALIILIVNNLDNLLPPIISRLSKIYFGRVSNKEMITFLLEDKKIGQQEALKIAENSFGRPGMAIDMITDKEIAMIAAEAERFLKSSGYARSQIIKNLIEEQKERSEILDIFFNFIIIKLRKDPVKNHREIRSVLSRFFLIKSYNVNKRLQIEAI
ncbi:MAG: DNA polymerase III subunit [Patescibacteria group bacterium]|nr:DNA polymerase III subunit [Patescibacteria group bacterium]